MADTPQETLRELKDLVVAYAKQEATDPLRGMARFVGLGLAGAVLFGTGVGFIAVGLLRFLQFQRGWAVRGNWSWVPYVVVVAILVFVAALVWAARSSRAKRSAKSERSKQS